MKDAVKKRKITAHSAHDSVKILKCQVTCLLQTFAQYTLYFIPSIATLINDIWLYEYI